jgi:hypothetical protein
MTTVYATEEQLKTYSFQMGHGDDIRHEEVLPRATEIIDLACGLGRGYFAIAGTQAGVKRFRTATAKRLRLAPYLCGSLSFVEYTSLDEFTPEYDEFTDDNETRWLLAQSGECWIPDQTVEATALWGWTETPEEIVQATLELAMAIWRGRDTAYARVVADVNGGNTVFAALPDRAKFICEKWRRRRAFVVA